MKYNKIKENGEYKIKVYDKKRKNDKFQKLCNKKQKDQQKKEKELRR